MFWNLKLELDGLLLESDLHNTDDAARQSLIACPVRLVRANCTEDECLRIEWISNADLKKDSSVSCKTSKEHDQRLETVLNRTADVVITVLADRWGVTSIRHSLPADNDPDPVDSIERGAQKSMAHDFEILRTSRFRDGGYRNSSAGPRPN